MRKLKFYFFVSLTFFRRHKWFVLAIFLLSVGFLIGGIKVHQVVGRKVITQGIVGTYTERDLPEIVTRLLSKSLIEIDKTGSASAGIAKGWQTDEKGTVYTFELKNDVYFTDGSNLRAPEIILSFPGAEVFYVDDYTLQFKIADIFTPFPTLLNKPVFKQESKIGTGPYRVNKIYKDQVFVSKLELKTTDKSLPDLNIRFFPSEKIARESLKLGEIQSIVGIGNADEFKSSKFLKLYSKENLSQLVAIFYNTKDPVLSDENFRLALSFAAPSIKNEKEAKTSLPDSSWAFNGDVKDYLDNPVQAKAYLDKVQNGRDSEIVLTATSSLEEVGKQVVKAWRDQGINARLKVESGVPQDFQALLIAQNIPYDPDQYSLWHSTQTQTNISKISSPRIDKDLEDGRKLKDYQERKLKYHDFQRILLDNAPATFLYFPKFNVIYNKKIESDLMKILPLQLP